eukprot:Seg5504.2 transcript_id=Seg5504.2/GoldUCD/mRNA.D3Y31 product="UBX domain-containing protein 10" protein_id=Seg5504.2/GoldUCD/D3Y31
MAKRDSAKRFAPTPPSSARPASRARSARSGRRILRTQSQSNDRSTPDHANIESCDFEPLMRELSISKYDVLPPIANPVQKVPSEISGAATSDKNEDMDVASNFSHDEGKEKINDASDNIPNERKDHSRKIAGKPAARERILSDSKIETGGKSRALYRKGDIFKAPREQSEKGGKLKNKTDGADIKNLKDTDKSFVIPPEPPSTDKSRLHLAFRHPEKERIQRYFSPTDRIGDVLKFLSETSSEKIDISKLGLHTNDFPTRKLEKLDATLFDCEISDKMMLNFIVYDDDK